MIYKSIVIRIKALLKPLIYFCCCICLFSCSNNTISPSSYILENYPAYIILKDIQVDNSVIYLLEKDSKYKMVIFEEKEKKFETAGEIDTDEPYGKFYVRNDKVVKIFIFIDNTLLKADSYDFKLQSTEDDFIIVKQNNVLLNDVYYIRKYEFNTSYSNMSPLNFYDEQGQTLIFNP